MPLVPNALLLLSTLRTTARLPALNTPAPPSEVAVLPETVARVRVAVEASPTTMPPPPAAELPSTRPPVTSRVARLRF